MKQVKRILSLLLTLSMVFSMAGMCISVQAAEPEQVLTVDEMLSVTVVDAVVMFPFTPDTTGVYLLESFAEGVDPIARLYDADGLEIAVADDFGDDLNFRLEFALEAGKEYTFGVAMFEDGPATFPVRLTFVGQAQPEGPEVVDSGSCGENVTWTLDSEGLLTISGTGAMDNWASGHSPWHNNNDVLSVVIADGVTTVGSSAFLYCYGLKSATIPASVTQIEKDAFYGSTNLADVYYGDSYAQWRAVKISEYNDSLLMATMHYTPDEPEPEQVLVLGQQVELLIKTGELKIGFVPEMTGKYVIESFTDRNVSVRLYDEFGDCIAQDEDSGTEQNFKLEYKLEAGKQYHFGFRFTTGVGYIPVLLDGPIVVNSGECGSSAYWNVENGVLTISGSGPMRDWYPEDTPWYGRTDIHTVIIQDGISVIGSYAFEGMTALRSAQIPNSVREIRGGAFSGTGLESIVLPDGIERIDTWQFSFCKNLKRVTIPASVKYIAFEAFYSCDALTEVNFLGSKTQWAKMNIAERNEALQSATVTCGPAAILGSGSCGRGTNWKVNDEGVLIISGEGQVDDVSWGSAPWVDYGTSGAIEHIVVEEGVTYLGEYVFQRTDALQSVVLPQSLTGISGNAFDQCPTAAFSLYDGAYYLGTEGNPYFALVDTQDDTVSACQLHEDTVIIADQAFAGTGLQYVTIPDKVTHIGQSAFYNTPLQTVHFGSSVKAIGDYAFEFCTMLSAIELPDSVEQIGYMAFHYCDKAAVLAIGSGLQIMEDYAFEDCNGLEAIYYAGSQEQWNQIQRGTNDFYFDGVRLFCDVAAYGKAGDSVRWVLDNTGKLTVFGTGAMQNYTYTSKSPWGATFEIRHAVIEEGITSIGNHAFKDCYNLQDVDIPASVTRIGQFAFYGCDNLQTIAIGEGVATIEAYAFSNCENLQNVTISESVSTIEDYAFQQCGKLQSIQLPNNILRIGTGAFTSCDLRSVKLPENLVQLCAFTFSGNYNLQKVELPFSLQSIGEGAFQMCRGLQSIELPYSISEIGDAVFYECKYLSDVYYYGKDYMWDMIRIGANNDVLLGATRHYIVRVIDSGVCGENVTWKLNEEGLLTISGTGAMQNFEDGKSVWFNDDRIWNVVIEEGVTTVGDYAFSSLSNLQTVTFPAGLESIGDLAFSGCGRLENFTLPESLTEIGDYAFSSCGYFQMLEIPGNVKSIGNYAFYDCDRLATLKLGSGVESIGDSAFYSCDYLQSITIPGSVKTIGGSAFEACNTMERVVLEEGVQTIGARAFMNCYSLVNITMPATVTQICQAAFYGSGLQTVYYLGTAEQWDAISVGEENDPLNDATIHCITNTLELDETVMAVTEDGQKVRFYFVPQKTGYYFFESMAEGENTDTRAWLYDSNGWLVQENDDKDGGDDRNFLLACQLEAGQLYYYECAYYSGMAGQFPVKLTATIVESLVLNPVTLIEQHNGYFQSPTDYYYYWNNRLTGTAVLGDGTAASVENGIIYLPNGQTISIDVADTQGYGSYWTVDNTYTGTASVMGINLQVQITIEQTPVAEVVFTPIWMAQLDGGDYQGHHDADGEHQYYVYYWWNMLNGTIFLKDGTQIPISNGWYQYQGQNYAVSRNVDQYYDNQWLEEGGYETGFYALGYHQELTVELRKTLIDHIDINPITIARGQHISWTSDYDEENGTYSDSYGRYNWRDLLQGTVYFIDGTSAPLDPYSVAFMDVYRHVTVEDDQCYENQWYPGEHTGTVKVAGYTAEMAITILDTPVQSAWLNPIQLIENVDCEIKYAYNQETGEYDRAFKQYGYVGKLSGGVNFVDNTYIELDGTYGRFTYNGEEVCLEFNDQQGPDNQWSAGIHTVQVSVLGYTFELQVEVIPCPIASIELESLQFQPETNGCMRSENGGEKYFNYDWANQLRGTVYFTDGNSYSFNGDYIFYNDQQMFFEMNRAQAYENRWLPGNTYYETIKVLGYETQVAIEILPSPIAGVETNTVVLIENDCGNICNDCGQHFCYDWQSNHTGKVYFTDGTETTLNGRSFWYNGWEHSFEIDNWPNCQNYWTVDNTYTLTGRVFGYQTTFTVQIVPSPVERVELDPVIMLDRWGSYTYDYDHELGENTPEYKHYSWSCYTTGTVYFKNGTSAEIRDGSFEYQGAYYNISGSDDQSYRNPWLVGNTYTGTYKLMGYTAAVPVQIVTSPISSIELNPLYILPENGWYVNDWYEDGSCSPEYMRYHYSASELRGTVYFVDGSSYALQGNSNGIFFKDCYYEITFQDDQSYENQWQMGQSHTITLSVLDYELAAQVSLTKTLVDRIEILPVNLTVGERCETHGVYDEVQQQYYSWNYYYWWETITGTVYFKDGRSYPITNDHGRPCVQFENEEQRMFEYMDMQNEYEKRFLVGSVYEIPYQFMGYEGNFCVTLCMPYAAELPIDSTVTVYYDGNGGANFFRIMPSRSGMYNFNTSLHTANPQLAIYDNMGELIDSHSGNAVEGLRFSYYMEAGRAYYLAASAWDTEPVSYELTVSGHPISHVNLNPITVTEGVDGQILTQWDEYGQEQSYFYYHWHQKLSGVVNFNDGGMYYLNGTNGFEYNGQWYDISSYDGQWYDEPWQVNNTYEVNIWIGDMHYTVPVTVVPSPIQNVTASAQILENTNGYETWGEQGSYYHYWWWNSLEGTVTLRDGATISFNGTSFWFDGQYYNLEYQDPQNMGVIFRGGNTYEVPMKMGNISFTAQITIVEPLRYGDFGYIVRDGQVYISSYYGMDPTVQIPAVIDGMSVVAVQSVGQRVRKLILPDSVRELSEGLFHEAWQLEELHLGAGIDMQVRWLMRSLENLSKISVSADNPWMTVVNGVLYDKDVSYLVCYPVKMTDKHIIPDTVTNIDNLLNLGGINFQLGENTSVTKYVMEDGILYSADKTGIYYVSPETTGTFNVPESVTDINYAGFMGCGFSVVNMVYGVTDLAYGVFAGATNLQQITLPESLQSINYWAFGNCSNLESIRIPTSIRYIAPTAFQGCTALTRVDITDLERWCKIEFWNDTANPLLYAHDLYLNGVKLTELDLSGMGLSRIGEYTFAGCSATSVKLPAELTEIGWGAFYRSGLTAVELPANLLHIGSHAFGESALQKVTFPEANIMMDGQIFANCKDLTEVDFGDTMEVITYGLFNGCGLKSVTIPAQMTYVGNEVFANCEDLTQVIFEGENVELGVAAFKNCPIENLDLSKVTYISEETFSGGQFAHIEIPEAITGLAYNSFAYNDKLQSLVLPENLMSVEMAFQGSENIEHVLYAGSEEQWNAIEWWGEPFAEGTTIHFNATGDELTVEQTETHCIYTCSQCGFSVSVPKNGQTGGEGGGEGGEGGEGEHTHSFTNYISNNDATCTADGTETAKCDGCDETHTRTDVGSKLEHSFTQYVSDGNATCTADGTETAKCDGCDETHTRADVGSKLDHSFTQYVSDGNATCDADGTETAKCDSCDETHTRTDVGSKLEHSFTQYVSDGNATCTADGTETAKCDGCDETHTRTQEGSAIGHNYVGGQCQNCGDINAVIVITKQPESAEAQVGEKVSFTVEATGEGLSYKWYFKNKDAAKFSESSNITDTYNVNVTAFLDGRQYYCVITDRFGQSVQTQIVTVSVHTHSFTNYISNNDATCTADGTETAKCDSCDETHTRTDAGSATGHSNVGGVCGNCGQVMAALEITQQPQDVTAAVGQKVAFTVVAEGDGLRYQWYFRNKDAAEFTASSNVTDTYNVNVTAYINGRQYYCVITDQYGQTVQTDVATVSILQSTVKITRQPKNVVAAAGQKVSFTVAAEGEGLSYQWYFRNKDADRFSASSNVTDTYNVNVTAFLDGREYYCVITDQYGATATSEIATVTVKEALKITQQPKDVVTAVGQKIAFTVKATGEGLSYKWYFRNKDAGRFSASSNVTDTYNVNVTAFLDGREYYCVITDQYGESIQSETVTVSIGNSVEITQQPENITAAAGEKVTLTVKANGEGLSYQWYFRNKGATKFTTSSSRTDTCNVNVTAYLDGREYYCVITDENGGSVTTDIVTITVQ